MFGPMRSKTRVFSIASIASLGAAAAACATNVQPDTTAEPAPTVQEQLQQPGVFALEMAESEAWLDGRPVPMIAGQVELTAVGSLLLSLERLEVQVDDMHIDGEHPNLEGLQLRDVRVRLAEPVTAAVEWTADGGAGFTSLSFDLIVDWSLVTESGAVVQLAPQRLSGITVELDVFAGADGELTAMIAGGKEGPVWSWADLVQLDDLSLDLRAERRPLVLQ